MTTHTETSAAAPGDFWRELRALLGLAAPLAAVHAGGQLMGMVDTAVVGRLGAVEQGAAGLANMLYFWISTVGIGVMMSLDPLSSQALGAGREDRARSLLWQGLWLGGGVGIALSPLLLLAPLVLPWFGISSEVSEVAPLYLWARLPGMIPGFWVAALRGYLHAKRTTRVMVLSVVVGNLVNLGLDLLLVFGGASLPVWTGLSWVPPLGVLGAGIATSLVGIAQFLLLGYVVWPALRAVPRQERRPARRDVRLALSTGLPIGLQLAAEVGLFTLVGLLAGGFAPEVLAAHQVALTLASFSYTAALGVSAAGSVRVGLAVGARDPGRVRRAGVAAFGAGLGLMAIGALVFVLLPGGLVGMLSDKPEVISVAIPLLGVAAVFQLSDAAQGVGAGVLRGAGDTRFPFVANVLGHYGVGLPVAVWLGLYSPLGVFGLWWGLCAGLSAVGGALLWRFWRLSGRPILTLEERQASAHH